MNAFVNVKRECICVNKMLLMSRHRFVACKGWLLWCCYVVAKMLQVFLACGQSVVGCCCVLGGCKGFLHNKKGCFSFIRCIRTQHFQALAKIKWAISSSFLPLDAYTTWKPIIEKRPFYVLQRSVLLSSWLWVAHLT